jgi:hypothetical protein
MVENTGVLCGNVKVNDNLENIGVDGSIILNGKYIGWEGVDYINFVEDRDKCLCRANAAMNNRIA